MILTRWFNVIAVQQPIGWLLRKIMLLFRSTLGIWIRGESILATFLHLLSVALSVLRLFFSRYCYLDQDLFLISFCFHRVVATCADLYSCFIVMWGSLCLHYISFAAPWYNFVWVIWLVKLVRYCFLGDLRFDNSTIWTCYHAHLVGLSLPFYASEFGKEL
jgi:hypothetical protein